jgi:hypothetical protein
MFCIYGYNHALVVCPACSPRKVRGPVGRFARVPVRMLAAMVWR